MSVLKDRRNTSKVQFIATAANIYVDTMNFLSRISARYGRLFSKPTAKLAGKVVDSVMKTQGIFLCDEVSYNLRYKYIMKALGYLNALDFRLYFAYLIMMKNPSGCFDKANKKENLPREKAIKRLDAMADKLGNAIDEEERLLKGLLASDKKKMKSIIEKSFDNE